MEFHPLYGSKGKVGLLTPAGGDIVTADMSRWLHPDILVSALPVPLGPLTPQGLKEMSEQVVRSAQLYRDYNPVDLAFFSCTSGSLIGGEGYDALMCNS